jgi:hypothetical protein
MADRLTVPAWSDTMGISKQAGYKAIARCAIPVVDGTVDPDVATVLYRKRTRSRANKRQADHAPQPPGQADSDINVGDNYWTSRGRREAAEAATAELRLAELRGQLTRVPDVKRAHATRLAALREGLLQIPARLAPVLAAETDLARTQDLLQRELAAVLRQQMVAD